MSKSDYIETPVSTKVSKEAISKHKHDQLKNLDTSAIVWHLVKRHKFGIVCTYAFIVSVYYFVPFAPDMLFSLVK